MAARATPFNESREYTDRHVGLLAAPSLFGRLLSRSGWRRRSLPLLLLLLRCLLAPLLHVCLGRQQFLRFDEAIMISVDLGEARRKLAADRPRQFRRLQLPVP